jgi:uracil-DNA glycosylase family 4
MPVYGRGGKDVLVVGEAPGATEDEQNRPFVGKAGQFLRDTLESFTVDLDEDAWTTNALICRPPKNATPDVKQISHCRPNIIAAIRKYQPSVIVTLGRSALVSILEPFWKSDIGPMEKWTGWTIPLAQHWICPTYHPSYLLRMKNPLMDRLFSSHLERAFEIKEAPPATENLLDEVQVLYDEAEIYNSIKDIDRVGGWVSVDFETTCIKPEWPEAKIVSCAISNGKHTIAYPWFGKAAFATGMLLHSGRTKKIASNLKMEERWTLRNFGRPVTNWGWDVMLATHCLDNRPGICSLKFQAFVKLGISSYNERVEPYLESTRGPYNRIEEIELKDLLLYNGLDAILQYRLAMVQRKEMGYD